MPFQAVVFDIDGTLVDNMPYHVKAWMALFKGRNVEVTEHDFETRFAGTKNQEILRALLPGLDAEEAKRLGDSKEEAYREVYRPKLTAMPGLLHLMDRLDRAGIRMAIASAAPPGNRELVLGGLGITSRFKAIVGAEHVQRGKPFPDLFLAAAAAIDVAPANCVAVEDALNGVRSAVAAGMQVLGIETASSSEALIGAGAAWTAPDFRALPSPLEQALFGA
jgi:beta-phosphoglucomutase family hydrolase